jgi:hypothetical protein
MEVRFEQRIELMSLWVTNVGATRCVKLHDGWLVQAGVASSFASPNRFLSLGHFYFVIALSLVLQFSTFETYLDRIALSHLIYQQKNQLNTSRRNGGHSRRDQAVHLWGGTG